MRDGGMQSNAARVLAVSTASGGARMSSLTPTCIPDRWRGPGNRRQQNGRALSQFLTPAETVSHAPSAKHDLVTGVYDAPLPLTLANAGNDAIGISVMSASERSLADGKVGLAPPQLLV